MYTCIHVLIVDLLSAQHSELNNEPIGVRTVSELPTFPISVHRHGSKFLSPYNPNPCCLSFQVSCAKNGIL